MYQLILLIHVFAAVSLIALVLVQQGKGATMGAAFGSGASQTVFGSRGSGSFLLKITIGFLVIFFSTSIALNYLASRAVKQSQQVVLPVAPTGVSPSSIPDEQPVQPSLDNVKTEKKK
jgi:preprotein translocase subunit SecG